MRRKSAALGIPLATVLIVSIHPLLALTAESLPGAFEEVGRLVTPASTALASWDDYVLVGTETGLYVQDLRDVGRPRTLHELDLGGPVQAIDVRGDSAIVTLASDGRLLVDLAGGGGPSVVPMPADFVFPNLFVGGAEYFVEVVDREVRVDELTAAGRVPVGSLVIDDYGTTDHVLEGQMLYVICGASMQRTVKSVSLADPENPVHLAVFGPVHPYDWPYDDVIERYERIAVRDAYVFLALYDLSGALRCVDFTDPAQPVALGKLGTGGQTRDFQVAGRWAIIGHYASGSIRLQCRVIDISQPDNLRNHANYTNDEAFVKGILYHQGLVLCATSEAVRMLQIPAQAGLLIDRGYTYGFLAANEMTATADAVYLIDRHGPTELVTVDVRDPGAMRWASAIPFGKWRLQATYLRVVSDALYLVHRGQDITFVDIGDPLAPQMIRAWQPADGRLTDIGVDGTAMAVAHSNGLSLYDLAYPLDPQWQGMLPTATPCRWAHIRDGLVVTALDGVPVGMDDDDADTLMTVDISSPSSPVELGRAPKWHLDMERSFLYDHWVVVRDHCVGFDCSITDHLFDISDPSQPEWSRSWNWGDDFWGDMDPPLKIWGYHCYFERRAYGPSRIFVYDLSDMDRPELIAEWDAGADITNIAVADNHLFVHAPGRLIALRFSPDAVPPSLSLSFTADPIDSSRLLATLTADEPLDLKETVIAMDSQPLEIAYAGSHSFSAIIPEQMTGRARLTVAAADLMGNPASVELICVIGRAGPGGGSVCDVELGLALDVPAGVLPGATRPVLIYAGTDVPSCPAGLQDTLCFRIEPAVPQLGRLAAIRFPVAASAVPSLQGWAGVEWADFVVRLDRATGTARALVDRLGRFRLIPRTITTPVEATRLFQPVPNPFNAQVNLAFDLAGEGPTALLVYDLRGRLVRTLHDGWLPAGRHGFNWDGRDGSGRAGSSGVYFYRLRQGDKQWTARCLLVK